MWDDRDVSGSDEVVGTFMFTDIVGSTTLWERDHRAMAVAVVRHDAVIASAVSSRRGEIVKNTGDGFLVAFPTAGMAAQAAADIVRGLRALAWPPDGPALEVRVGIHTGQALRRDGDYFGHDVSVTSRVTAMARGSQILLSDAALSNSDDLGHDAVRSVGIVSLRGVSRPVALHQLLGADLPGAFPPLPSLASPLAAPRAATSLIGRDAIVRSILDALDDHPVVTLVGPGGVGKTRLAVEVAHHRLSDSTVVWWCDLTELDERGSVERAILTSGGLGRGGEGESTLAQIANATVGRQVLVVIDNAEHLVSSTASACSALTKLAASVRMLVTSREPLGLPGERVIRVEPLAHDDAVALFAERAAAASHQFSITSSNASAVGELCDRLDGLPLALELAATRTPTMSPAEISQLIGESQQLLRDDGFGTIERHRSVDAAIAWSWHHLGPADRQPFAALSVFAAPFDLDAAHAVTAAPTDDRLATAELLTRLTRCSLVAVVPGDTTRYRLLETVRVFARSQRTSGPGFDVSERWSDYYLGLAHELDAGLRGADAVRWIGRARPELAHLRSVVRWAIDASRLDVACELCGALDVYAFERMDLEIGEWADAAVRASNDTTDPAALVSALGVAAKGAWMRGDLDRAGELAQRGCALDPDDARLAYVAGLVSLYLGDVVAAVDGYGYSLERFLQADDSFLISRSWADVALMHHLMKRTAEAVEAAEQALVAADACGSAEALAHAHWARGLVGARDSPDAAEDDLRLSMELASSVDARLTWNASASTLERLVARRLDRGSRPTAHAAVRRARDWATTGQSPAMWDEVRTALRSIAEAGFLEQAATLHGAFQAAGVSPLRSPDTPDRYEAVLAALRATDERTWDKAERAGRRLNEAGVSALLERLDAELAIEP